MEEDPDSGLGLITAELSRPAYDGNQEEFGKSRLLNRKGGIATGQDKQTSFLNIFTLISWVSWTYPSCYFTYLLILTTSTYTKSISFIFYIILRPFLYPNTSHHPSNHPYPLPKFN
jgi:hypothetical protein